MCALPALSFRFDESEMVSSVLSPAGSVVTSPAVGRDVVITDRLPPRTDLFIARPVQGLVSSHIYCNLNTSGKKVTSNTLIRVPICDSITRRIKIENIEHDKNNNHFTHQEDLNKNYYSFVN